MMKCKRCGAELLDTDTFCVKCGQKVDELPRCPKCGEILREGTRFCHKCGASVVENSDAKQEPEDDEIPVTGTKTVDIPFDLIEKSIIMEAEQAVVKRDFKDIEKKLQEDDSVKEDDAKEEGTENYPEEGYSDEEPVDEEYAKEEPLKAKSRKDDFEDAYEENYAEEDYAEEDYAEDDDSDEDYEDNPKFSSKGISISNLTMILGAVILVLFVIVGIVLVKNKLSMRWDRNQDEVVEQQENKVAGKIQVLKNVNIRNQPDTENSSILGVARTGEVYEYYELVNDNWYHIRLNDGSDGYVYKDYVDELSGSGN